MSALLTTTVRQQRRAFLGWAAGLAAVAAMYAAFYPSIHDSAADFQGYMDKLPEALRTLIGNDFTTPAGYLRSETFSTLGLILMLVFAIGAGSRAIAGEEEGHTLDLLLSTPVRRRHVTVGAAATSPDTAISGRTVRSPGPTAARGAPLPRRRPPQAAGRRRTADRSVGSRTARRWANVRPAGSGQDAR